MESFEAQIELEAGTWVLPAAPQESPHLSEIFGPALSTRSQAMARRFSSESIQLAKSALTDFRDLLCTQKALAFLRGNAEEVGACQKIIS